MRQILGLASGIFFCVPAHAVTLDAVDRGWYIEDGTHQPDNLNYCIGECGGGEHHNFFVFDLPDFEAPITSASLVLWNPIDGFQGPDPEETYTLYDYAGSIASLLDGTGGIAAFDDLGSGVEYGSVQVTAAANYTFIEVQLNAAALSAIQSAAPGLFVIGGAQTTLNEPGAYPEFVFGNSGRKASQLCLDSSDCLPPPLPEPTTALLLLGPGLLGSAVRARRRLN